MYVISIHDTALSGSKVMRAEDHLLMTDLLELIDAAGCPVSRELIVAFGLAYQAGYAKAYYRSIEDHDNLKHKRERHRKSNQTNMQ